MERKRVYACQLPKKGRQLVEFSGSSGWTRVSKKKYQNCAEILISEEKKKPFTVILESSVKYGSNEHARKENSPVKKLILSPLSIFFFIFILTEKKFACNKQI